MRRLTWEVRPEQQSGAENGGRRASRATSQVRGTAEQNSGFSVCTHYLLREGVEGIPILVYGGAGEALPRHLVQHEAVVHLPPHRQCTVREMVTGGLV